MSRPGDLVRTALRGTGQTMITIGVVLLLFCVYELQVTNFVTARAQERLGDELQRTWTTAPVTAEPATPDLGTAFARLYAPSLAGYEPWNVVEGVTVDDLKEGPGHIPSSALPGEIGNVVLSGHRTTYGAPFNRWAELVPGSVVVLETRDRWFTYVVSGSQIVRPDAIEVTYPVPGDQAAVPTRQLLTMTTCHPKYSAQQRLIVSAELTASDDKAAGLPVALRDGA